MSRGCDPCHKAMPHSALRTHCRIAEILAKHTAGSGLLAHLFLLATAAGQLPPVILALRILRPQQRAG